MPTSDIELVRLNADGSLVASFGAAGIATAEFTHAKDVAIQAGGKIILVGRASSLDAGVHTHQIGSLTLAGLLACRHQ